jgi:hypothetical protein
MYRFWACALRFQRRASTLTPAAYIEDTKAIHKKYISTSALFQVNISDKQRLAITQELEKAWKSEAGINAKIFDRAQSEVFQLMYTGPFPRFRGSALFEQLKAEIVASGGTVVDSSLAHGHTTHAPAGPAVAVPPLSLPLRSGLDLKSPNSPHGQNTVLSPTSNPASAAATPTSASTSTNPNWWNGPGMDDEPLPKFVRRYPRLLPAHTAPTGAAASSVMAAEFEELLSSERGFLYFSKFVASEYATENLLYVTLAPFSSLSFSRSG